ncbi:MAG: metallophosphoesterase, partial [Candidatus Brocadiaceae bacterium]
LYYSVDYRGTHFIVLYTDEALQSHPRIGPEQIEWLRDDLAACTADQVFVLMHKPMWEYGEAGWEEVHRLLREYPVKAVIAGHYHHYYRSENRDGIQHYVLGVTGGRTFSPELAGGLEHYCLLHVRPDSYELTLVRPGCILSDDYVVATDFKAMEKLRFLSPQQTGPANALRSPETGRVRDRAVIAVTNPLGVPLIARVRGRTSPRGWRFRPSSVGLSIGPGESERAELEVSSGPVDPQDLRAPEVEIQYDYVDSRGRTVPIVLDRRIPLHRKTHVSLCREAFSVDGNADEEAWKSAPLLTTQRWRTSPYESDEDGPFFRIVATKAGVYLYAESPDGRISGFRGERMLSDAIFVGAVGTPGDEGRVVAAQPPVVVLYPFAPEESGRAVQAYWDPKRPVGVEAAGVYLSAEESPDGQGWRCEAFVPWDLLLGETSAPPRQALFNVGAWDNDGELFTELHSWAPTECVAHWGSLLVRPAAGR